MTLFPALLAAALLLVRSGLSKARRPEPAARAFAELGIPAPRVVVLVGAVAELAAGAACAVRPEPGAVAVGSLYLVFAAIVAGQLRRGVTASCGCLGSTDSPPSRTHVALNLALVAVAFGASASSPPAFAALLRSHPAGTLVLAAAATGAALLLAAAVSLVPAALGAYRRPA